jgi:hypothetical protein
MGRDPIKINVAECLRWMTDQAINNYDTGGNPNVDATAEVKEAMMKDPLIEDLREELIDFANCDGDDTIDMLDSETWKNKPYNFKKAERLIWNAIAPRAAHQQRVENLVQTAGHLGKTHVEEERRSARAKIHSIFYRDFKIWALDIVRKEDEEERKRQKEEEERERANEAEAETTQQSNANPKPKQQKPKRWRNLQLRRTKVEGKRRLELHAEWIDKKLDEMEKSIEFLESRQKGIMKVIRSEMRLNNKSSRLANEATLDRYEQAANREKNRDVESKHLMDITSWMEGSVILSFLNQKDGARAYILAEIKHRKIIYFPEKAVSKMTKEEKAKHKKKWDGASIARLKSVLRAHEHGRLTDIANEEKYQPPKLDEIKNIKPLSQKMQQWLPIQWQIYKKRKGQVQEQPGQA